MVRMLVTINISKGWKTWSEMAKGLEPQMNEQGAKMIWAGANPDETAVYVLAEAKDPSFVKTFGERPDIVEIRDCLLYTSPSPRDRQKSRMPSSA